MTDEITLKIESCRDCPHLREREVRHWLAGNSTLFELYCTKAGRIISPADGIKPPPKWCPLRKV